MTPSHLITVTTWVNWVAEATGVQSGIDPEAAIKTRAGMLGEKYPDSRMFTQASAAFAAMESGVMSLPSVGILGKFLEKWWANNQPVKAIKHSVNDAELNAAPLTGEDRMAVQLWLEHDLNNTLSARDITLRLAIIRGKHRPGFDWLMAHNTRARDIAANNGWTTVDTSGDYTDPGRVLASVRNILHPLHPQSRYWLSALRAAVERHAPELAELVPLSLDAVEGDVGEDRRPTPQQSADVRADDGVVLVQRPRDDPRSPPPRPAGTPSPEHILARRLENPLLRPIAEREAAREAERKLSAAAAAMTEQGPPGDDDWTPSYLRVVP